MQSNNAFPIAYRPFSARNFIHQHIEQRLSEEGDGWQLEIETRLGSYAGQPFPPELVAASFHGPLVLAARVGAGRRELARLPLRAPGRFAPSLPPAKFHRIGELCARFLPTHSTSATIDFCLQGSDGTRLSWDLNSGNCYENAKRAKENIDLIHQNCSYRISTALERTREIGAERFAELIAANRCESIRLKQRQINEFQFMHFCLTKCVASNDESAKRELLTIFNAKKANAFELASKALRNANSVETFEVESEVSNTAFLRETLRSANGRSDFSAFIDRFLRNTELLIGIGDENGNSAALFESETKRAFGENAIAPIIGSQLASIIEIKR